VLTTHVSTVAQDMKFPALVQASCLTLHLFISSSQLPSQHAFSWHASHQSNEHHRFSSCRFLQEALQRKTHISTV